MNFYADVSSFWVFCSTLTCPTIQITGVVGYERIEGTVLLLVKETRQACSASLSVFSCVSCFLVVVTLFRLRHLVNEWAFVRDFLVNDVVEIRRVFLTVLYVCLCDI